MIVKLNLAAVIKDGLTQIFLRQKMQKLQIKVAKRIQELEIC